MLWVRRLWGGELFRRTRNRLTLLYSGVLILFLTAFVVIVYSLLRYWILNDQERELRSLADREQRMLQNHVRMAKGLDSRIRNNSEIMSTSEDQLFTYILDEKGLLVQQVEAGRWDREALLKRLQNRTDLPEKIYQFTIGYTPGTTDERKGPRGYREPLQTGEAGQIRLMITGRPVMQGSNRIGTVFVGKNVSYHYELLNWMLLALCGLALVFFAAALGISRWLSGRIMVPVQRSYDRQRQFAADASHELRTPLSVLQSSIDALELEQPAGEADPFVRKLLTHMKDEVKRMTRLTSDLLTLARSDSAEPDFSGERFDLVPLAGLAVQAMSPVAAEKNIGLSLELPPALPVYGDPERLKQLLYILLDNAFKYTPAGGSVTVKLLKEERFWQLSVRDTGIGIAASDLPRIFDRFYRADKSRSRQSGGHGLGLSIARWIVEFHKGTIRVASKPDEGSTFTVRIPFQ